MQRFFRKFSDLQAVGLTGGDMMHEPPIPPNPPAPVSEIEVAALESHLGIPLPGDYREFLLEIGGVMLPGIGLRPPHVARGKFEDYYLVSVLYGGEHDRPHYDIWTNEIRYRDRIPRGLIAIGDCPSADQLCLAITGAHRGRVYMWDHESCKTSAVASSFDDLVDRLVPYPGYR